MYSFLAARVAARVLACFLAAMRSEDILPMRVCACVAMSLYMSTLVLPVTAFLYVTWRDASSAAIQVLRMASSSTAKCSARPPKEGCVMEMPCTTFLPLALGPSSSCTVASSTPSRGRTPEHAAGRQ